MADEEKPNTEKNLLMKYSNCEKRKRGLYFGVNLLFLLFSVATVNLNLDKKIRIE